MRAFVAFCLAVSFTQPVFAAACDMAIGDVVFEEGDVKSTSVVHGTSGQAVIDDDVADKLRALSDKAPDATVPIRIGTYRGELVIKDILGKDIMKDDAITIPGSSTSEGLVMQQALKGCQ